LAPVRCSGGFDRKRGSPGPLPRPCGFSILRRRSTFADDRMSPILNSRMLSSRASFEARSTIAARDQGSVGRRVGDRPMPGGRRLHHVAALSHATWKTQAGDRRGHPRSPSASERAAACPIAPSDERPRFAVERSAVQRRRASAVRCNGRFGSNTASVLCVLQRRVGQGPQGGAADSPRAKVSSTAFAIGLAVTPLAHERHSQNRPIRRVQAST